MKFHEKIDDNRFLVTAELGPPQSCDSNVIRKKTAYFRNGVDAVNITDNQTAIVRLSSIAAAKIVLEEGLEPVIQMTCRDRNRIAIQSDLLGAAALGISNVLCLTGDHQRFGNHPESKPVFDLDSVQLIAAVKRLNEGFFLSGESIKTIPHFCIGGGANPFAEPYPFRIMRLAKKIKAGARFFQTQPVFDLERFAEWMQGVRELGLHQETAILAGVMPVKSAKALLHMQKEVPGMRIQPDFIQRMERARDPEEEGIQMASEIIEELKKIEGVRGIHLMPLMWERMTPRILEVSGLMNR